MDTTLRDKLLRRASSLRELRDKANNANESLAAARALARLCETHRIEEADLRRGELPELDPVPVCTFGKTCTWRLILLNAFADALGVAVFKTPAQKGVKSAMLVSGRPGDTALVRFLFAWAQDEAQRQARLARIARADAPSWYVGFAQGLGEQCAAGVAEARGPYGTDADAKRRAEEARTSVACKRTPPKRRRVTVRSASYKNGHAAGSDAHIPLRVLD